MRYALLAVARPRHPLAWLGAPFAHHLIRRFRDEGSASLRAACEDPAPAAS